MARAKYFSFWFGGQEVAVPILRVSEVVEFQPPSRVPTTPPYVLGAFDLRGKAVSVIDPALKLGIGSAAITEESCIVLVDVESRGRTASMGVLADAVGEVIELSEEPPATKRVGKLSDKESGIADAVVLGAFRYAEREIQLLDLDALLDTGT